MKSNQIVTLDFYKQSKIDVGDNLIIWEANKEEHLLKKVFFLVLLNPQCLVQDLLERQSSYI